MLRSQVSSRSAPCEERCVAFFRHRGSMNHEFKLKAGEMRVTNDARLLNYAVKSEWP